MLFYIFVVHARWVSAYTGYGPQMGGMGRLSAPLPPELRHHALCIANHAICNMPICTIRIWLRFVAWFAIYELQNDGIFTRYRKTRAKTIRTSIARSNIYITVYTYIYTVHIYVLYILMFYAQLMHGNIYNV